MDPVVKQRWLCGARRYKEKVKTMAMARDSKAMAKAMVFKEAGISPRMGTKAKAKEVA